jgi:hypothetical protein
MLLPWTVFAANLASPPGVTPDPRLAATATPRISGATRSCLTCHRTLTPGLVQDWESSRHAGIAPADAMQKSALEKRISATQLPEALSRHAVGCFECHGLNAEQHPDAFDHFGRKIHTVVSPNDCQVCHPAEVSQYRGSKKAHALGNLMDNPLYHTLVEASIGQRRFDNGALHAHPSTASTRHEACLGCHGTLVVASGTRTVTSNLGDAEIPQLEGWPNQGVGRRNPDGSLGACTSCHPRHAFSIEVARKPSTCGQCHLEPDVPAYNVYKESKHGNIYNSLEKNWDFTAVPWQVGKHFTAPTCATCHNSLITHGANTIIAERTHDFGARLWVRIFGLPYTHPQPTSGDTTSIRNKDGLPLPTTFSGEPATEFLLTPGQQNDRKRAMTEVCGACHSAGVIEGHFAKFDQTLKETDAMTLTATRLVLSTWEKGFEDKTNPFDETLEKMWVRQWLFYGNSIRYASAMTGAPDYAAFKNGWWELNENLSRMHDVFRMKGLLPTPAR